MEKEIYVLLMDNGGTTHSIPEPFGVAVETEDEAKKYVAGAKSSYSRDYAKVRIFIDCESATAWAFPTIKKGA